MFGHIEEPHELAEHMRVVRAEERTEASWSSCRCRSSPSTRCFRTHGIEEIPRGEPKQTAAFRLALGKRVRSLQASRVKMGLRRHRNAALGVNDLGGTLMEENISRLAGSYHGVRLDPPELIAAAHRAGRPAAERTTLYGIRARYPLVAAAA